ncbi:MAG: autotransporter domain-containing protein, partial [Planctomycetaceae bacterium]|nr:autotransporter domain-containing protein [Planctomycetaceae bacterium]
SADALGTGSAVTGIGKQSGKLIFDLTKDSEFAQTISGTGSVEIQGGKTLTLTKANTYSGGTTVGSGAAVLLKTLKSLGTGNIIDDGEIIFDAPSGTFGQTITGNGSITKNGAGTLELTAANTFNGDTNINGGKIVLRNENALQNSTVNAVGGKLTFSNLTSATVGGLNGTQDLVLNNESGTGVALTLGGNGRNAAYSGVISGGGSIIKTGTGTQIFSGENTYSGGTVISGGKLVSAGVSGFGTGNVRNDAEMEFDISKEQSGTYKGIISGAGVLSKTGSGLLTLTGQNTYTGGTLIEQGRIDVAGVQSLGSGDIAVVNKDAAVLFDITGEETLQQKIIGTGDVWKKGKGTLTFASDIETNGTTHIYGGTAFINGRSASQTVVYDNATLGGRGYVDNTVLFKTGSKQVIGHSADAGLSGFAAKNINYEGGTTIYVKINENSSDQIVASNGFNFAQGTGTVDVVLVNLIGSASETESSLLKKYDIFIAEDGTLKLDGVSVQNQTGSGSTLTVDGIDGGIHFLADADDGLNVLGYSVSSDTGSAARSIAVDLAVFSSGTTSYLSDGQRAVLQGLGDPDVFAAIYKQPRDYRGGIIGQLAPYIQTAMPFMTQRAVTQFNSATYDRLRFLREPLALHDGKTNTVRLQHIHCQENYIWFQNYGDYLRLNQKADVPEFQADSYGFNVGFDKSIDYHSSVGLGMGGYFSEVRANEVFQKGKIGSYLISLYGNWVGSDAWSLAGSTGFVFSDCDLRRSAPAFDTQLNSRHNGTTFFASIEGAKKLLFGQFEVTPYAGADLIWFGEEGYREHAAGNPDLALRFRSDDSCSLLSTMGLRLGRSVRMLGGNVVNPSVYAAWVLDWTQSDTAVRASFGDFPAFKIWGASMNKNRADVGANVNMTLNKRADMFARFNTELAHRYSALTFHWGMRLGF